jgi:hypothetical protein
MIFLSCSWNPKTTLQPGPRTYFPKLRRGPWFTETILERTRSLQCSPWAGRPHRRPNPRSATAGLGRRAAPGAATDLAWAGGGLGRPAAASLGAPDGVALPCPWQGACTTTVQLGESATAWRRRGRSKEGTRTGRRGSASAGGGAKERRRRMQPADGKKARQRSGSRF